MKKREIGSTVFLVNVKLNNRQRGSQGLQKILTSSSHTLGVSNGESSTSSYTFTVSYGLCVARAVGAIVLLRCLLAGCCGDGSQFKFTPLQSLEV
jgi:hypothetical protein